MLSASELAGMVTTATGAMPDTCTITRIKYTSDQQGGEQLDWPTVATNVPCRLRPGGGATEEIVAAGLASVSRWTLTVPALTDILPKDRVLLNGVTYEVVINWGPASWEIDRQCLLIEIQR